ncbi:hypothetical protein DMUE_3282 [Dictyocoela muelleri]|nr:hypothetical protein DMUE_3282 [Dictyocoela muelleri]
MTTEDIESKSIKTKNTLMFTIKIILSIVLATNIAFIGYIFYEHLKYDFDRNDENSDYTYDRSQENSNYMSDENSNYISDENSNYTSDENSNYIIGKKSEYNENLDKSDDEHEGTESFSNVDNVGNLLTEKALKKTGQENIESNNLNSKKTTTAKSTKPNEDDKNKPTGDEQKKNKSQFKNIKSNKQKRIRKKSKNNNDFNLVGIANSGNICFASSVLQCLFSLRIFRNFVPNINENHNFSKHLKNIFEKYTFRNKFKKPKRSDNFLLNAVNDIFFNESYVKNKVSIYIADDINFILVELGIRKTIYSRSMEDSAEFFLDLTNKIFEEINTKSIFRLKIQILTECMRCEKYNVGSVCEETMLIVHNFSDTLQKTISNHYLDNETNLNKYRCNHYVPGQIPFMNIVDIGDIIVIYTARARNINEYMTPTLYLDPEITLCNKKFRLIGYVNYYLYRKHYTAVVRRKNSWFDCNDGYVSELDHKKDPYTSTNSFLVFYELI